MKRLLDYARAVLGPCELVEDCTWGYRRSLVLRLRDATGVSWFIKAHGDRDRYLSELAAYRSWVPALDSRAPRLHAFDSSRQAMILSAVPGQLARWPADTVDGHDAGRSAERAVHRDAGKVLSLLHSSRPATRWDDFAAVKIKEFDSLTSPAAGLLRPRQMRAARAEVETLAGIPPAERIPCHHDYTPRNWLVHDGSVHVVDFEWSSRDVWVADLARLHLGIWATRPDLREAFLGGYGRDLDEGDRAMLRGCAVLTGVWLVVKAHETGQPSFEEACRAALLRLIDRAG
ncbi:MAG TPA: phosphotransferase [Streptosporangiaceae bacterium]|nr:phosphotransferase [Streptosporangiaceae bacterium]